MKKRIEIPIKIAAQVLFNSDRVCCKCRNPERPVQIHHIDENPSNYKVENLAVLCLDCHTETMIIGGFHRKLDADQVILYRDDWVAIVKQKRSQSQNSGSDNNLDDYFKSVLSKLEILKERKQYYLLAMEYNALGNNELRDKYIDLVLKDNPTDDTLVFLRTLQNQKDKIPPQVLKRVINSQVKNKDWSQLARTYESVGDYKNAILNYTKAVIQLLEDGNIFSAAFYLKELSEKQLYQPLFAEALEVFTKDKDLWWQFRSLQELAWTTEVDRFLLDNEKRIIKEGHPGLIRALNFAKGDIDSINEMDKNEAKEAKVYGIKKNDLKVKRKSSKSDILLV